MTSMNVQEKIAYLKSNLPVFAEKYLRIRGKAGGAPLPFVLNRAQLYVHNILEEMRTKGEIIRVVLLKGRQQGMSTYVCARYLHRALFNPGTAVFILAHISDSTDYLFKMVKRMYDHLPAPLQPTIKASNRKELIFGEIGSEYALGTAGSKTIGRGTTPLLLHGSEAAFYENTDDLATGLMQGVPLVSESEIILESTANGMNNMFYNLCMKGCDPNAYSRYKTIFVPWYWQEEYCEKPPAGFHPSHDEAELMDLFGLNLGQIFWRRMKLEGEYEGDLWKFMQEYPCIAEGVRVSTDVGLIPIEQVWPTYKTPEGEVEHVFAKGRKMVYKVKTAWGYEFEATEDHLTLTKDNEFVPVKDLVGQHLVPSEVRFAEHPHHFTIPKKIYGSWVGTITPDFARMLGLFMGDGSMYGATISFVFDKKDRNVIEWVKKYFRDTLNLELAERIVGSNGVETRCSNNEFRDLLDGLGCLGTDGANAKKRKVCVPECIWRSPKPVVREFLRGLFDADGFVSAKGDAVKFFTKHLSFMKDVQLLLLGFGLVAKINTCKKKSGYGFSYIGHELVFWAEEARLFNEVIGFLSDRKIERSLKRPKRYNRKISARDVAFEVIGIEYIGEKEVFDLVVPKTNTFNVNGMVVHNCTLADAFVMSGKTLIEPRLVDEARKRDIVPDAYAPKVLGVDGAASGDRTVLVLRQGKKILGYWPYSDMTPMRLAGIIAKMVDEYDIDMVFLDVAYGYGARDRLKELGYGWKTHCVHFGETKSLLEPDIYKNKRAEMYGFTKEWFEEGGADIPNDDAFCKDMLMAPGFKQSGSRGLMALPSKEEIKADNGGTSPDIMDALVLTFAFPVNRRNTPKNAIRSNAHEIQATSSFLSRRMAAKGHSKTKPSELYV